MIRTKIGLDWDDVISPFVRHAAAVHNMDHPNGLQIKEDDIKSWGKDGSPAIEAIYPYYNDERSYNMQTVTKEAVEFIRKLQEIADVYIVTAVGPQFMSLRAKQIFQSIPDFPADHILMGAAKHLVKLDIHLDDGPHNILKSGATYPVLFRKPWNQKLSGVLAVNTYDEFLTLVEQIQKGIIEKNTIPKDPCVYAIVGPSGSRKRMLANELKRIKGCKESVNYCIDCINTNILSLNTVLKGESITDTIYAGHRYTMSKSFIQETLSQGKSITAVVDMCGAMALKKEFPTVLIFCRRSRESMIAEVLDDLMNGTLCKEEANLRLLSMEQVIKNEILCDISVRTHNYEEIQEFVNSL